MLDYINMFLDPQCIVIQENFQKQIMNCAISSVFPLLARKARKMGQELIELSTNSEAAV